MDTCRPPRLERNLNAATSAAAEAESTVVSREQRLMTRLHQGDESAMQELLDLHGPMLARPVGRLTGWRGDRDAVLQEVFLSIWQKAGSFRGDGPLEGWLTVGAARIVVAAVAFPRKVRLDVLRVMVGSPKSLLSETIQR